MSGLALPRRPALLAVGVVSLVGLVIRLVNFDQGLFGDELSTYWIVHDHSLGHVLGSVRSTDEITPPLYFVLSWLSLKVGSHPEWVRLPSLLAGIGVIPLVYLLGARTVGRAGGVVAAAAMALNPFMIYYSTEARSYALMILLLVGSTLALLAAAENRRLRWWVLYAACSAGAMLSHYTAAFPLAAQLAWALWAHPPARRSALLANAGAVLIFSPWIPGYLDDQSSPTTQILSALQPFDLHSIRVAIESWAIGYPYVTVRAFPGTVAIVLFAVGVLLGAGGLILRAARRRGERRRDLRGALAEVPKPVVLIAALAAATPLGEALYSLLGTNLLGARNLNSATPGLVLGIGYLLSAAGPLLGVAAGALILGSFGIGAGKTLQARFARADVEGVASFIDSQAGSAHSVVIDAVPLTPVPQTALDIYLSPTHPEFRPGLPVSDHPFAIGDPVPPPDEVIDAAYRRAARSRAYLVLPTINASLSQGVAGVEKLRQERKDLAGLALRRLPPGSEIVRTHSFPGVLPLAVVVVDVGQRRRLTRAAAG